MKRIITMIAITIILTKGDVTLVKKNINASLTNSIENQPKEVEENTAGSRRNLFDYTLKTEEEVNEGCGEWFYLMDADDNYVGWSSFLSVTDRFFTYYPKKEEAAHFRQCKSPWKNDSRNKYMQAKYKDTAYWLTWSGSNRFLESIFNNDPNFGIGDENSPSRFFWESTGKKDKDNRKYWKIQAEGCWIESGNIVDRILFWWLDSSYLQCSYLDYSTSLDKRLYFDYSSSDTGRGWKAIDVDRNENKFMPVH